MVRGKPFLGGGGDPVKKRFWNCAVLLGADGVWSPGRHQLQLEPPPHTRPTTCGLVNGSGCPFLLPPQLVGGGRQANIE